jgi:hypothetical protein
LYGQGTPRLNACQVNHIDTINGRQLSMTANSRALPNKIHHHRAAFQLSWGAGVGRKVDFNGTLLLVQIILSEFTQ